MRRRPAGLRRRGSGSRDLLADRELHRRDLLHLADDDFLRDAPKLFVLAVAQFEHGHVDRALMVRRHHGDEVAVDVAGRLCLHGAHHPVHRGLVFGEESAFIRSRSLLRRRMSFVREHREHQRRCGESDEEAHAEDRRAQAGFEKLQHWIFRVRMIG